MIQKKDLENFFKIVGISAAGYGLYLFMSDRPMTIATVKKDTETVKKAVTDVVDDVVDTVEKIMSPEEYKKTFKEVKFKLKKVIGL